MHVGVISITRCKDVFTSLRHADGLTIDNDYIDKAELTAFVGVNVPDIGIDTVTTITRDDYPFPVFLVPRYN